MLGWVVRGWGGVINLPLYRLGGDAASRCQIATLFLASASPSQKHLNRRWQSEAKPRGKWAGRPLLIGKERN